METTARFYLERMRLQIERARRRQFPAASSVPAKWLAYVDGWLKSIEWQLANPTTAASADVSAEHLLTTINACYEALDHLSRADTSQVADYVVGALLRWFEEANRDCDYLFTAEKEFELFTLFVKSEMEVEAPHDDHQLAIDALKPIVYRITMPGGALGAAFHIPLVGHEVGHVLIESFANEIEPQIKILSKGVKHKATYQRWLHEIIADTICGFISGPAAFFALHEKLRGDSKPNVDYPENAIRTKSLWDFTSKKFLPVFVANSIGKRRWSDWSVRTNSELGTSANGHGKYAHLSSRLITDAPKARALAIEFARRHIGELEYSAQGFASDLKMHLKSFLWAIPPFESFGELRQRKPTTLSSVLNVGWFIAAFRLDELKIKMQEGPDRKGKVLVELDRLMQKSIELSEIRRQWEDDSERTRQGETAGSLEGERAEVEASGRAAT